MTSWDKISTSSFEFEIIITRGAGATIEVMVIFLKLRVVSKSFFSLLLFCSCSKILTSFVVGACKASGST
jgi:hypothetical protein